MVSDEDFTVPTDAEAPKRARKLKTDDAQPGEGQRTRVRFLEASGPGGSDRVTLCVDGVIYSYARNEDVDVPDFVLSAANDAAPAEMDPKTGTLRRVPSFPYQIVR